MSGHLPECYKEDSTDSCICSELRACEQRVREGWYEVQSNLKAAGWKVIAQRKARKGWSTPSRPRDDARYMTSERTLWEQTP